MRSGLRLGCSGCDAMKNGHELKTLIDRLTSMRVLTSEKADRLHRKALDEAMPQMLRGKTYGEAMGGLTILNQDEQAFRAELKSVDSDLGRQIEIVDEALDGWFKNGVTPAPYYAWRIAVILSKDKRKDEEATFLAAWCKHFGTLRGSRYEALAKRAKKLGVF